MNESDLNIVLLAMFKSSFAFFALLYFETISHYVALGGLELHMQTRFTSHLQSWVCATCPAFWVLRLQNAPLHLVPRFLFFFEKYLCVCAHVFTCMHAHVCEYLQRSEEGVVFSALELQGF